MAFEGILTDFEKTYRHENVVELIEICRTKPDHKHKKRLVYCYRWPFSYKIFRPEIHLVFEFCEHDLAGLLANKNVQFTLAEKKKVIQQLLEGSWFYKIFSGLDLFW